MNTDLLVKLVKAICNRAKDSEGFINKTKLIKLIYLIDIANYKNHRTTLTGFSWIFYEYGPWAYEFNSIFELIQASPDFSIERKGFFKDSNSIYCSDSNIDFSDIGSTPLESIEFRSIVDKWASEDLNRLLNYVYFYTEPMVDAEKHKKLDFEKIFTLEEIPSYKRQVSTASEQKIDEIRRTLNEKRTESKEIRRTSSFEEKFDLLYWTEIEKMNLDESY